MTTTSLSPYLGLELLNVGDFFQSESILHPFAIGSIAIASTFCYLRLSSNRTVAPLTIWDKLVNVALGSTLAGIVNGNSLTRGLLALFVLLGWQYLTSSLGSFFPKVCGRLFTKPPLVIAFRGRILESLLRKHRITRDDLNGALRIAGVWNICEVECIVLEPTGAFSVYLSKNMPKDFDAEVLLSIQGYKQLSERENEDSSRQRSAGRSDNKPHDGQPQGPEDKHTAKEKSKVADSAA